MNNTTQISELPIDPMFGGNISNNITLSTSDTSQNNVPPNGNVALDQSTINQIVSGLQQATQSGSTMLNSRDIPQNTNNITTDERTQLNYIPHTNQNDYISNIVNNDDIVNNYNKSRASNDKLDYLYGEIQFPLLISVLYFLFQLPIFKKYLFDYFPVLFSKDGNYNINGFLFTSTLFGFIFHALHKITTHFAIA
jgi:ATP-dependent Zn protease